MSRGSTDKNAREKLEQAERVFQALAHATRRQIMMAIHFRGGVMSAGEIAARFAHSWATTTGHLNALVESGLLRRQHDGRKRLYTIDLAQLSIASDWLRWFEGDAAAQTSEALKSKSASEMIQSPNVRRVGKIG